MQRLSLRIDNSNSINPFGQYWYTLSERLNDYNSFSGHLVAWCEVHTAGLRIRGVESNHEYYFALATEHVERALTQVTGNITANMNNIGLVVAYMSSANMRGDPTLASYLRRFHRLIASQGGLDNGFVSRSKQLCIMISW
jgi:hypothetical protein